MTHVICLMTVRLPLQHERRNIGQSVYFTLLMCLADHMTTNRMAHMLLLVALLRRLPQQRLEVHHVLHALSDRLCPQQLASSEEEETLAEVTDASVLAML